jgi:hypothetical protein
MALALGSAQGRGEGAVAEVDSCSVEHLPIGIDDDPKPLALVEECQPRASGITINTLFMHAGNLTRAHQNRDILRRNGQSFCDEISADLNGAVVDVDLNHGHGAALAQAELYSNEPSTGEPIQ